MVAYRGAIVVTQFMCYYDEGHSLGQLYKGTKKQCAVVNDDLGDHFHETWTWLYQLLCRVL